MSDSQPLVEMLFGIKSRPFRAFRVFRGLQLRDLGSKINVVAGEFVRSSNRPDGATKRRRETALAAALQIASRTAGTGTY